MQFLASLLLGTLLFPTLASPVFAQQSLSTTALPAATSTAAATTSSNGSSSSGGSGFNSTLAIGALAGLGIATFFGAVTTATPPPVVAPTGIPFGGLVTAIQPCNSGLLVTIKNAVPGGATQIMWNWGELPYPYYIPPHPGQWLLGMLAPVPEVCFLGIYPHGAGFPIEYHGESF